MAELEMVKQPNLVISVRQPDKITLQPCPTLPGVRAWMQGTRRAWRVLTSGGGHAEAYLEKAIEAAKAKTDAELRTFAARLMLTSLPKRSWRWRWCFAFLTGFSENFRCFARSDAGRARQLFLAGSCWLGACGSTAEMKSGTRTWPGVR